MRKRFIAIFLASGLVMGVCGCGSKSVNADEYIAQMGPEEVPVHYSGSTEPTDETPDGNQSLGIYSADELMEMVFTGELTIEEIEAEVATGTIDYETYGEMLKLMPTAQDTKSVSKDIVPEEGAVPEGDTATVTDEPSEKPETNFALADYMITYVREYDDQDGYSVRETWQLSPIFTESNMDTVYALWEALGEDIVSFPSEDSLYSASYLLRDARDTASCNELEYIVGTYAIENLTNGFPITADNPRTYTGLIVAKHVSAFDEEHDATAADFFNRRSVVAVTQSDTMVYYGNQDTTTVSKAKMSSDTWGPVHFIIVLPNGSTPNRPDGYHYDDIQLAITPRTSNLDTCDLFQLTYFE